MTNSPQDPDAYTPPQALVADPPDRDLSALSKREKAVAWVSIASYTVGAVISLWLLAASSFSIAALLLSGLSALGLISAAFWLKQRVWPLYVLPLLYLPQVVRVASPDFNFFLSSGFQFHVGLKFGIGDIGINIFALFMLVWSGLAAAGRLDKLDSAPSQYGA